MNSPSNEAAVGTPLKHTTVVFLVKETSKQPFKIAFISYDQVCTKLASAA